LGLYHTFKRGCLLDDAIGDTPAEAEPYRGCDPSKKRDTCPQGGLDPIHNFMDYSDDICMYKWTNGQIDAMHASIDFYRSGSTPDMRPVQLTEAVWTDVYTVAEGFVRQFYIDLSTTDAVICETTANNGDIDLFVGETENIDESQSSSEGPTSNEICFARLSDIGKMYIWVYGHSTTVGFQVRCSVILQENLATRMFPDGQVLSLSMAAGSASALYLAAALPPSEIVPYSRVACSTVGIGDVGIFLLYNLKALCTSAVPGSPTESFVTDFLEVPAFLIVFVYAPMASNIDLTCVVTAPIELIDATASDPYSLTANNVMSFYLQVTTLSNVECTTNADNGNIALVVTWGSREVEALSCYSDDGNPAASIESCSVGIATGSLHVLIYAVDVSVSGFTVQCTVGADITSQATQLTLASATAPVNVAQGDILYFYVPHQANMILVECNTTATDGDVDLYAAWNDAMTFTCFSQGPTSAETCRLGGGQGNAFAIVSVNAAATDFSIICDASFDGGRSLFDVSIPFAKNDGKQIHGFSQFH